MDRRERIRRWENARTARLNARGLTSRGTPMTTRRRVYGRSKLDYQRLVRAERLARGLTIRGTIPKRQLARHWSDFRAAMEQAA